MNNSKSNFKNTPKNKPKSDAREQSPMSLPREMVPILAQAGDPLGSYTGTSVGDPHDKTPVQDADDL
jgi:hypothetical protein